MSEAFVRYFDNGAMVGNWVMSHGQSDNHVDVADFAGGRADLHHGPSANGVIKLRKLTGSGFFHSNLGEVGPGESIVYCDDSGHTLTVCHRGTDGIFPTGKLIVDV